MLEQRQLDHLGDLWQQRGAQIATNLAPGLDPDDARRLVRAHPPLELSDELALWFSWHDGAPVMPQRATAYKIGGPLESRPLASSLSFYEECLEISEWYDPDWLPIFSGKNRLLAQCSPNRPLASEIWLQPWSQQARPILSSFGDLIEVVIELIEVGAWTFHPGYPDSKIVDDLVPSHIRELGFT